MPWGVPARQEVEGDATARDQVDLPIKTGLAEPYSLVRDCFLVLSHSTQFHSLAPLSSLLSQLRRNQEGAPENQSPRSS